MTVLKIATIGFQVFSSQKGLFFKYRLITQSSDAIARAVNHTAVRQYFALLCDLSSATVFPGLPDHVPAPRCNNLSHHLFLCEQHGTSGNSGHVSPRRSRRADRGEDE